MRAAGRLTRPRVRPGISPTAALKNPEKQTGTRQRVLSSLWHASDGALLVFEDPSFEKPGGLGKKVIELACHQGTAAMTRCEYLNLSFGHQNPIPDPDDFMNHLTGG